MHLFTALRSRPPRLRCRASPKMQTDPLLGVPSAPHNRMLGPYTSKMEPDLAPHSIKPGPQSKARYATVESGDPAFREGHRTLPSRKAPPRSARVHETWRLSYLLPFLFKLPFPPSRRSLCPPNAPYLEK